MASYTARSILNNNMYEVTPDLSGFDKFLSDNLSGYFIL